MGRKNKSDDDDFGTNVTDDMNDAEFVEVGEIPANVRRLRVYDNRGDFIIDIPADAKATFGYFNPASAASSPFRGGYDDGRGEMRRTALRIYGTGGDKNQLAVFCGVKGFRDEGQVKLTRLREEITLTSTFTDDGEGATKLLEQGQRTVKAVAESEIPF